MSQTNYITAVLNSTIDAMNTVIPMDIRRGTPQLVEHSIKQKEMSVLIGVAGKNVSGRLVFEGAKTAFTALGVAMFGAELEGEMLESFIGEFGNIVAGNMASELINTGVTVNITPPTVLVGSTKISGFNKGILVPVTFGDADELHVLIVLENDDPTAAI